MPSAKIQVGRHGRHRRHVDVFSLGEQREAHRTVLGVVAGHEFLFSLGKIKRRAVGLRHARNHVDDETERLQEEEKIKRRLEKRALIIALLVVIVFGLLLVLTLISNDEKFDRSQPVQVPEKIVMPKKTASEPD